MNRWETMDDRNYGGDYFGMQWEWQVSGPRREVFINNNNNNNKWFILLSLYSNQMCRDLLVFCYNKNEMQYKSEDCSS